MPASVRARRPDWTNGLRSYHGSRRCLRRCIFLPELEQPCADAGHNLRRAIDLWRAVGERRGDLRRGKGSAATRFHLFPPDKFRCFRIPSRSHSRRFSAARSTPDVILRSISATAATIASESMPSARMSSGRRQSRSRRNPFFAYLDEPSHSARRPPSQDQASAEIVLLDEAVVLKAVENPF